MKFSSYLQSTDTVALFLCDIHSNLLFITLVLFPRTTTTSYLLLFCKDGSAFFTSAFVSVFTAAGHFPLAHIPPVYQHLNFKKCSPSSIPSYDGHRQDFPTVGAAVVRRHTNTSFQPSGSYHLEQFTSSYSHSEQFRSI